MTKNKHNADVEFIRALAEILEANDLNELQVKREYADNDSLNVRVRRGGEQIVTQVAAPAYATAPAVAPAAPAAAAPATEAASDDPANLPGAVTSPMVGTAYLAAEPGAAPFVSVGSQVSEGDTLMIVEAMKTMNHIPAPASGTVKRILVTDGDAVEYGAPLMVVE